MHKIVIVFATLSLLLTTSASAQEQAAPTVSHTDLLHIEHLREHSPSALVRKSLSEEYAFRTATQRQLAWMHTTVHGKVVQSRRSIEDIRAKVLARMNADLTYTKLLNHRFSTISTDKGAITWSCKTNKLVEILTEAIPFFEQHAELLLHGQVPQEFHWYWEHPRCLGPCETRAPGHNSRELALKASLLLLMLELDDMPHVVDTSVQSLEDSAFVHTTQLPKDVVFENIQKLSFFYNGTLSPLEGELTFVHGGYAFGGQNDDSHFRHLGPFGKQFGPQDCSSWVSKIVGLSAVMSTVDYAQVYRDYFAQSACQNFDAAHRLTPAKVTRFDQVRPGMILIVRKYNLSKDPGMNETLGTSGHAQLIIDVDPTTHTMLTLEYSRDLPAIEGFGVKRQSFTPPADIKAMYFTTE